MKILFSHLKDYLRDDVSIQTVSDSLYRLGHENDINNGILDIEFTPNKGDCLSVYGVARDLNAIHNTNLNPCIYEGPIDELKFNFINDLPNFCPSISFLKIEIDQPVESYKPYLEEYFNNLNISKKNFFTDISNFVNYEIGQPTHCYNYEDVKDGITLSLSNSSSLFKTLLGKNIKLDPEENIFKRGNEIINLAGIMGGDSTKCRSSSKTALVECAFFNPDMIIGKSVKYDLISDAAYKFERGTDIQIHEIALRRFIKIVEDHAKINSVSIQTFSESEYTYNYIKRDYKRINKILGTSFSEEYINSILKKLGFTIHEHIKIPSWRRDIESINDLAEEVARVVGYENINHSKISINNISKVRNINSDINRIRAYMVDNGFTEIINDPFVSISNKQSIRLDNPLDSNRQFLRLNIINSLSNNLDYNEKRQKESIKLFEISDLYENDRREHPKRVISLIISGRQGLDYKNFNKKLDKEYLSSIINKLGLDDSCIKEFERDTLNSKIKNKIFYVECEISDIDLLAIKKSEINIKDYKFNKFKAISELPSSFRDISISIDDINILEDVVKLILDINIKNLKDKFIFDFFHNDKNNVLKIGFRFIFQSNIKTLEEDEIDKEMSKVFKILLAHKGVNIPGLIK